MDEIKQQIKKIIENEYRDALKRGLLDSTIIVNKIWVMLTENEAVNKLAPEPAYGCFENFDE